VDANTQNIATALQATTSNMEAISTAMQGKFLEIRARQEGQRHRATVEGTGSPMN
jgi:hypothetical protein